MMMSQPEKPLAHYYFPTVISFVGTYITIVLRMAISYNKKKKGKKIKQEKKIYYTNMLTIIYKYFPT